MDLDSGLFRVIRMYTFLHLGCIRSRGARGCGSRGQNRYQIPDDRHGFRMMGMAYPLPCGTHRAEDFDGHPARICADNTCSHGMLVQRACGRFDIGLSGRNLHRSYPAVQNEADPGPVLFDHEMFSPSQPQRATRCAEHTSLHL